MHVYSSSQLSPLLKDLCRSGCFTLSYLCTVSEHCAPRLGLWCLAARDSAYTCASLSLLDFYVQRAGLRCIQPKHASLKACALLRERWLPCSHARRNRWVQQWKFRFHITYSCRTHELMQFHWKSIELINSMQFYEFQGVP